MKAVILTEAGGCFGYGHLSRCTAIKQALNRFGVDVKMYVRGSLKDSDKYTKLEWLDSFDLSLFDGCEIAIVDSYHASLDFYKCISESIHLGVWLDDTDRLKYPAGMVIKTDDGALLRESFAAMIRDNDSKERIFVSLGGTKNEENLLSLIDNIRAKYPNTPLTIASPIDKSKLAPDDIFMHNADEHTNAKAMSECAMAVCAGGQTLLELASLGVPSVAVIIAKNQEENVKKAYKNNNIVGYVDIESQNWAEEAAKMLQKKHINKIEIKSEKIAFNIIKTAKLSQFRDNLEIDGLKLKSFVNLDKEEALEVFGWRNHHDIRKWMLNSNSIAEEEHFAFLNSRKSDEKSFYWLVYSDNIAIGVISIARIDWQNRVGYCGWYAKPVNAPFGCGLIFDRLGIKLGFELLGLRKIIMDISADNKASIASAIHSGFVEEGRIKNYFWKTKDGQDIIFYTLEREQQK